MLQASSEAARACRAAANPASLQQAANAAQAAALAGSGAKGLLEMAALRAGNKASSKTVRIQPEPTPR